MKKLDLSYMGPVFEQARLDANMTQDELAERVGITSRFLQAIESNERGVSFRYPDPDHPGIGHFSRHL